MRYYEVLIKKSFTQTITREITAMTAVLQCEMCLILYSVSGVGYFAHTHDVYYITNAYYSIPDDFFFDNDHARKYFYV